MAEEKAAGIARDVEDLLCGNAGVEVCQDDGDGASDVDW